MKGRWRPRPVWLGPVCFRDPVLLCAVLYPLLCFDASGFLRIGLAAAVLHEMGHVCVYGLLRHRLPVLEVTMTGFCMQTRGQTFTAAETAALAAAGPGMNALLAAIWALKMEQSATIRGSAFLAANLLTGAFNLLPIPPLDGAQLVKSVRSLSLPCMQPFSLPFWRRSQQRKRRR